MLRYILHVSSYFQFSVIESDDSDDMDSPGIPGVTHQGLAEPSTSKGSSSKQYKYFRPSYRIANTSDSAPSPPPTNSAGKINENMA